MARLTTRSALRLSATLLWVLAAWNCWVARGLFADGSATLLAMMRFEDFALFFESRRHAMAAMQTPAAVALWLGVTDTQLLARLFSLGAFIVPTALYHACLVRARHDTFLLAVVIGMVAAVYVPTAFFIVGEYNGLCSAVLLAGLVLATGVRASVGDGLLLVAIAAFIMRSYETTLAYGLLLAGLTAWRAVLARARGGVLWVYGLAALLFAVSAAVAARSLLYPDNPAQLGAAFASVGDFVSNVQFVLPFAALLIVAMAALAVPQLLLSRPLYICAALPLVVLVAVPLVSLLPGMPGPLAHAHYPSRMGAGALTGAAVVVIWLYSQRAAWPSRTMTAVATPAVARRLLAFQVGALIAALPADLLLTERWRQSVTVFQSTISRQGGLIAFEDTPLVRAPYLDMVEGWALPSQSLVLRRAASDGVVLPPRGSTGFQPFAPGDLPRVDRFLWGGQGRIQ